MIASFSTIFLEFLLLYSYIGINKLEHYLIDEFLRYDEIQ